MAEPPTHHRGTFVAAAATVLVLDQLTKHWAVNALADGPIELVGSLQLNLTSNDGAAFSLGGGRTTWIALVGIGVAVIVARWGWMADRRGNALGLGILLGGALGNLTDRALRDGSGFLGGRVIDFVDVGWWPVFNVADSALWVGIGVLAVTALRDGAQTGTSP